MKISTILGNIGKQKIFKRFAAILFWLAVWHIISLFVNQEILIVSPVKVIKRIGELIITSKFWMTTGLSFIRIFGGLFIGVLAGIIFAILTSKSSIAYNLFYPVISVIKATPVASFIVLAFVWVKSPYIPMFVSFLIVLPVVWANVLEGIKSTDVKLLEMAGIMQIKPSKVFFKIYLPSVKPYFIAAFSSSMGMAWKSGTAAEVITRPKYGIGTEIYNSKIYIETRDLFAWTIIVIIISVLFEKFLLRLMKGGNGNEHFN